MPDLTEQERDTLLARIRELVRQGTTPARAAPIALREILAARSADTTPAPE